MNKRQHTHKASLKNLCALSALLLVTSAAPSFSQSCSTELKLMKKRAASCETQTKQYATLENDVAVMQAKLSAVETAAKTRIASLEQQITERQAQLDSEKSQNAKLLSEFQTLSEARGKQISSAPAPTVVTPTAAAPRAAAPVPPVQIQVQVNPTQAQESAAVHGAMIQRAGPLQMTIEGCVAEANYYAICTIHYESLSGESYTKMPYKTLSMIDTLGNEYMVESVTYGTYHKRNNIDNQGRMESRVLETKPFKAVFKFRNVPATISGIQSINYTINVNRFEYPTTFSYVPLAHK